jgi:Mn-containing catalase
MEKGNITEEMGHTKVIGKIINQMDSDWRLGRMAVNMKVIIKEEKNTERVFTCGLTNPHTTANGMKEPYKELVNIIIKTVVSTQGIL